MFRVASFLRSLGTAGALANVEAALHEHDVVSAQLDALERRLADREPMSAAA